MTRMQNAMDTLADMLDRIEKTEGRIKELEDALSVTLHYLDGYPWAGVDIRNAIANARRVLEKKL